MVIMAKCYSCRGRFGTVDEVGWDDGEDSAEEKRKEEKMEKQRGLKIGTGTREDRRRWVDRERERWKRVGE